MKTGLRRTIVVLSALSLAGCSTGPTSPANRGVVSASAADKRSEQPSLRVAATGRLIDTAGVPVPYLPIKVQYLDGTAASATTVFTGADGRFRVADLLPGGYQISPPHGLWGKVSVRVMDAPRGRHSLGDIVLPTGN